MKLTSSHFTPRSSAAVLSNMVATGHVWLFKGQFIKIKNSVSQSV